MRMNQRELLTSGQDSGGVWHAFYASASRTLCNVARPERGEGRHAHDPTCEVCMETAQAFDRIDGSCPPHWFRAALAEVAAVERLGPDAAAASSSTRWTRESIVVALQLHAAAHEGLPPRSGDWALYAVDRPNVDRIRKVFGSWADAVEAAGFPRPRPGVSPSVLAGLSGRTGEAGPSPAETESRGLARTAPGKTPVRPAKAAATIVSRFEAIRNHIDRMERELLEDLEREAAA